MVALQSACALPLAATLFIRRALPVSLVALALQKDAVLPNLNGRSHVEKTSVAKTKQTTMSKPRKILVRRSTRRGMVAAVSRTKSRKK